MVEVRRRNGVGLVSTVPSVPRSEIEFLIYRLSFPKGVSTFPPATDGPDKVIERCAGPGVIMTSGLLSSMINV